MHFKAYTSLLVGVHIVKGLKGNYTQKFFYVHFLGYFNKVLIKNGSCVSILKLHGVRLWSYSTAKFGKFK